MPGPELEPLPSRRAVPPGLNPAALPSVNADGKFSLARQLGLGISRIVTSPYGQVLKMIRENEPRAVSLGYEVDKYKLLAFVLAFGELGVSILIAPPGEATLPIRIYTIIANTPPSHVAALALLQTAVIFSPLAMLAMAVSVRSQREAR